MKFYNENGVQYIILEKNDSIYLTTENSSISKFISVECENDMLNISGDSSLIKNINGNNILEKVFVQPVLSSEEIINKCDKWLEMFKKIHDKFRELVLKEKYLKMGVYMSLSFYEFFSSQQKNNKFERIDLDLVYNGTIIQKGITITADKTDYAIYEYLLANVLQYYLLINYADSKIPNINPSSSLYFTLFSSDKREINNIAPIYCYFNQFYHCTHKYSDTVRIIINNHNLSKSSEQLIDELKRNILKQQLSEHFNKSINESIEQYEYIMSHPLILEKKKKN